MRRAKVPLSKVASAHELPLIMQIHDTYKLMIERARYALDILNGAHQTNVTVSREPADFLSAPASVSEIKQIIERSLLAHASRIEKAKGAWQKKNDHVMFISREYTKQAESPMGVQMRLSACVLGLGFALFHPFLLGDGANIGTIASANEATWSSFDLGKARAILSEFEISDLDLAEAIYEWENLILRAQRASASDEILKKLREQQKHWRSMSVQMKKQLEDVITRAKKDAKIRLVANVLKMGRCWQARSRSGTRENWRKRRDGKGGTNKA